MFEILPPKYINNFINIEPPNYTDTIDYPPSYEIIFPQNIVPIQTPIIIQPIRSHPIVPNSSPSLDLQLFSCNCLHNFIKCNKSIYDLLCCNIGCYKKNSPDTRCCGICYNYCRIKDNNYNLDLDYRENCEFCLPTLKDYCNSGYIITYNGIPRNDCTLCCLPLKLPLFMPCFLGTIFNQCINCIRDTNTNYLF
jgi:hypothetical protein